MSKKKATKSDSPEDRVRYVVSEANQKELLELSVSQLSQIKEFMASREDLANLETRITNKISSELKPFQDMVGEFKIFKKVFYTGLGLGLAILLKMAFAPTLFTYSPN